MVDVMDQLAKIGRRPTELSPRQFQTSTNSQGQMSEVADFTVDTALAVRTGRSNPLRIAIPAYESKTTDGTAGNTETFALSYDLIDTPNTGSLVLWENGTLVSPDSVDFANDSFDYTDDGTGNTLHVYYIPGNAATLEVRKIMPNSKISAGEALYEGNLGLVHNAKQAEQPEYFTLNESELQRFLAADMDLEVRIDAPYQIRWEDPDGDGTEPTNALLQIPAQKADSEVEGLGSAIRADMGDR